MYVCDYSRDAVQHYASSEHACLTDGGLMLGFSERFNVADCRPELLSFTESRLCFMK